MASFPVPFDPTRRIINVNWGAKYIRFSIVIGVDPVDPDGMTFEPGTDPNDTIGWESRAHIGGTPSVTTASHPLAILFLKGFSITPDFIEAGSIYKNGSWISAGSLALSGFSEAQQVFSFGDWQYSGHQFISSGLGEDFADGGKILGAIGGSVSGPTVLLPNGQNLLDESGNTFSECSSASFIFKAYQLTSDQGFFYNDFDHDERVYSAQSESSDPDDLWLNGATAQTFNISFADVMVTHSGVTYEAFAANMSAPDPSITINVLCRRPQ